MKIQFNLYVRPITHIRPVRRGDIILVGRGEDATFIVARHDEDHLSTNLPHHLYMTVKDEKGITALDIEASMVVLAPLREDMPVQRVAWVREEGRTVELEAQPNTRYMSSEFRHVAASTDSSLGLPGFSPEFIQAYVNNPEAMETIAVDVRAYADLFDANKQLKLKPQPLIWEFK